MSRRRVPLQLSLLALTLAAQCPSTSPLKDYDFDSTSKTETWIFTADDGRTPPQRARVIVHGCGKDQCTGATLTSAAPTWRTMFGNCAMPWNISGNMSGNLVSFTINGSGCVSALQGRASGTTGGGLKFGSATTAAGTMTWNGYTDFLSGGRQSFNGSAQWRAQKFSDGETAIP